MQNQTNKEGNLLLSCPVERLSTKMFFYKKETSWQFTFVFIHCKEKCSTKSDWHLFGSLCDIRQTNRQPDRQKITSSVEVTNRERDGKTEREGRGEKEAVCSNSGSCISYHSAAMFVYFLSGVNIYAWLQPSHLRMSALCTITQTLCTNTRATTYS